MTERLFCCDDYLVSSDGYVISKRFDRPLKPSLNKHGYELVNLSIDGKSKTVAVHRAVAIAFVPGYADGLQVNHKDGNKRNNRAENLEWMTGSENVRHAIDVLGLNMGGKNSQARKIAKLDKKTGREVCRYQCITDAAKEINEEKFENVKKNIWRALNGLRKTYHGFIWKYVDDVSN